MTLRYEAVKYYQGYIGGNQPSSTVVGFADPNHYDTTRSALARPGSTSTVFGQGGIVDAGIGILEDLNAIADGRGGLGTIIGGVQTALTLNQTLKNYNSTSLKAELNQELKNVARGATASATRIAINSFDGKFFPK